MSKKVFCVDVLPWQFVLQHVLPPPDIVCWGCNPQDVAGSAIEQTIGDAPSNAVIKADLEAEPAQLVKGAVGVSDGESGTVIGYDDSVEQENAGRCASGDVGEVASGEALAPCSADAIGETVEDGALPVSQKPAEVEAEQPILSTAGEQANYDTTRADAVTSRPAGDDTPGPGGGTDGIEQAPPSAGDELVDAGPGTEPDQVSPDTPAVAKDDEAVNPVETAVAPLPDAVGETVVDDLVPASHGLDGVAVEKPASPTADDRKTDDPSLTEADDAAPAGGDTPGPAESTDGAEPGGIPPGEGDALVLAAADSQPEQPGLVIEAGMDHTDDARSDVVIPDAALDPSSADAAGSATTGEAPEPANAAKSHEVHQGAAGGALVEDGSETKPEQPGSLNKSLGDNDEPEVDPEQALPVTEAVVEGDVQVTGEAATGPSSDDGVGEATSGVAVDLHLPGGVGETAADDVMPASQESAGVEVEQPAVASADELPIDDTATAHADAAGPAGDDPPRALEGSEDTGGGQSPTADAPIATGPETEPEPTVPVTPAVEVDGDAVNPEEPVAATLTDAVGETAVDDVIPASQESEVDEAEQRALSKADELASDGTARADEDPATAVPSGEIVPGSMEGSDELENADVAK